MGFFRYFRLFIANGKGVGICIMNVDLDCSLDIGMLWVSSEIPECLLQTVRLWDAAKWPKRRPKLRKVLIDVIVLVGSLV